MLLARRGETEKQRSMTRCLRSGFELVGLEAELGGVFLDYALRAGVVAIRAVVDLHRD